MGDLKLAPGLVIVHCGKTMAAFLLTALGHRRFPQALDPL
jgi:hypothetical protein